MVRSVLIATLLLSSIGHRSPAQEPIPINPMDQNAALSYWQAFALLPEIDDDVRKRLPFVVTGESPVDDDLRALVASSENALRYLHRATRVETCAWGLAYEAGPYAYMPHLSKARELARVALLRARIRFESGQLQQGMDDVVAAVQLGRHAGQEGVIVLINILVGFAIETQAIETIADSLHHLDQTQRDEFQRRLGRIKPVLDMQRAGRGERDVFLGWLVREIENGRSKDAIFALVSGDIEKPVADRITGASQDQLLKWAKDMNPIYDKGFEIMSLPPADAMQKDKELNVRLRDEKTGNPLGALFLPGFGAGRRAEATFITRKALLNTAFALCRDGKAALARPEHRDPFGDGPFELKQVDGGVELISDFKRGDQAITLRVPGVGG